MSCCKSVGDIERVKNNIFVGRCVRYVWSIYNTKIQWMEKYEDGGK